MLSTNTTNLILISSKGNTSKLSTLNCTNRFRIDFRNKEILFSYPFRDSNLYIYCPEYLNGF